LLWFLQEQYDAVILLSYTDIREKTGLSPNSISKAVRELVDKGLLYQARPVDQSKPATYILCSTEEVDKMVDDKKEVLEDIQNIRFREGETKKAEQPKQKKGRQSFRDKNIYKWNGNDLLHYFASRYREHLNMIYPPIIPKERKLAKVFLENSEYDMLDVIKAIDYYLKNYQDIPGHPNDYPSWPIFYSWKNTIIPMALYGKTRTKNTRSHEEIPEEEYYKEDDVPKDWGFDWNNLEEDKINE